MKVNHVSIYTKTLLSIYNIYVLGLSNRFAWKCPSKILLKHYNQNISLNHLDVGVGTGYFLDHCNFPDGVKPSIHLMDLNPNSLEFAAKCIQRYQPKTHLFDILKPLPNDLPKFDSIGISYLLHCLPGTIQSKEVVFKNLIPLLKSGGVIFGATILGKNTHSNYFATKLLSLYNRKNIFHNLEDDFVGLTHVLKSNFKRHAIHQQGNVAIFSAHI